MFRKIQEQQLSERLREVKGTINILCPMIMCCKDELNQLTLQEMSIRTAMRIKMHAQKVKTEAQETASEEPPLQRIEEVNVPEYSQFGVQNIEQMTSSAATGQTERDVDYREFLTLDPDIIKCSSGEEDDDDEEAYEGQDDLSEGECADILLSDGQEDGEEDSD